MIVDDKHALIAFPVTTDESLRQSVKFYNRPDIVAGIRTWYDNYLWHRKSKES
jgi:hypothetical protein